MAIGAKKSSGSGPIVAMEDGINLAVVTAVTDLGVRDGGQYGPKYKVAVEFTDAEGRKASRIYNGNPETQQLSLHEKSNLTADLKALFGQAPEELEDLEKMLLGQQAQIITEQYTNAKGYTNAKVTKVLKPAKGQNVVVAAAPTPSTTPVKKGKSKTATPFSTPAA